MIFDKSPSYHANSTVIDRRMSMTMCSFFIKTCIMKHLRLCFSVSLLVVAVCCFSCSSDSDEPDNKIPTKEESNKTEFVAWQNAANADIKAVYDIVNAATLGNEVRSAEPVTENGKETGFKISFVDGNSVSVKTSSSASSNAPTLGVKEVDGVYCWTVKVGNETEKMVVTAGGSNAAVVGSDVPKLRIDAKSKMWELSLDGGMTYSSLGQTAQEGSSTPVIKSVDIDEYQNAISFALFNGQTISATKEKVLSIGFEGEETLVVNDVDYRLKIVLPKNLKEEDYLAIKAELLDYDGESVTGAVTRTNTWYVDINKPTFKDGIYQDDAYLRIGNSKEIGCGVLTITLVTTEKGEISCSRPIMIGGEYADTQEKLDELAKTENNVILLSKDSEYTMPKEIAAGVRIGGNNSTMFVPEGIVIDKDGVQLEKLHFKPSNAEKTKGLALSEAMITVRNANNVSFKSCSFLVSSKYGLYVDSANKLIIKNSGFTGSADEFHIKTMGLNALGINGSSTVYIGGTQFFTPYISKAIDVMSSSANLIIRGGAGEGASVIFGTVTSLGNLYIRDTEFADPITQGHELSWPVVIANGEIAYFEGCNFYKTVMDPEKVKETFTGRADGVGERKPCDYKVSGSAKMIFADCIYSNTSFDSVREEIYQQSWGGTVPGEHIFQEWEDYSFSKYFMGW